MLKAKSVKSLGRRWAGATITARKRTGSPARDAVRRRDIFIKHGLHVRRLPYLKVTQRGNREFPCDRLQKRIKARVHNIGRDPHGCLAGLGYLRCQSTRVTASALA